VKDPPSLKPVLVATPLAWDFGPVLVGERSNMLVTISSAGGSTFTGAIEAVVASPFQPGKSTCVHDLPVGDHCGMSFEFVPDAPGAFAADAASPLHERTSRSSSGARG
jgi:hypothetical protein